VPLTAIGSPRWKERFRAAVLLASLAVLAAGGCAEAPPPPKLDGEWRGNDWGQVLFVGLRGSYSSTYGPGPGEIRVTEAAEGAYAGTWGEGERRHGKLKLRFESRDVLVGEWSADPTSTIKGQPGGIIRWNRKKP